MTAMVPKAYDRDAVLEAAAAPGPEPGCVLAIRKMGQDLPPAPDVLAIPDVDFAASVAAVGALADGDSVGDDEGTGCGS